MPLSLLQAAFEQMDDSVLITTPDLNEPGPRIVHVNPAFTRMTGYEADEVIGRSPRFLQGPLTDRAVLDRLRANLEAGQPFHDQSINYKKDGTPFDIEWHIDAIRDDAGTITHWLAIQRDVTARAEAERAVARSEARFRQLVETSAQLIWTAGPDGRFVGAQPDWTAFTGLQSDGGWWLDAVYPDDLAATESGWRHAIETGTLYVGTARLIRADGTVGWTALRAAPVPDGDGSVREWIGAHSDIDALMTAEGTITRQNAGMQTQADELRRLSRSLQGQNVALRAANERLEAVDQVKSNFISSVSHEIRTPLTSIKSFAKILQADLSRKRLNDEKRTQFLGIINEESDRLTRLINDVLDIAKMESGKMTWNDDRVSPGEIIDRTVATLKPLAEERGLNLRAERSEALPELLIDGDRLQQVLTNLIANAVKFTEPGGQIVVRGEWIDSDERLRTVLAGSKSPDATSPGDHPAQVYLSVTDTGLGIEPGNLERIFDQFHQVTQNDALDKPKGTGLGLPITRHIVEHYGGQVWATSDPDHGSTFHLLLPATIPPADPELPETPTEPVELEPFEAEHPLKVLVVDDEPNIRTSIHHELESRGWTVIEAKDGLEAVELARREHPDLITLDLMMPALSGFDVISILKGDESVRDIPILMVSILDDVRRGLDLGADDAITKPLDSGLLTEKIVRLARINRLRTRLQQSGRQVVVWSTADAFGQSLLDKLRDEGYEVSRAADESVLRSLIRTRRPNLLLIDTDIPDALPTADRLQRDRSAAQMLILLAATATDGSLYTVTLGQPPIGGFPSRTLHLIQRLQDE